MQSLACDLCVLQDEDRSEDPHDSHFDLLEAWGLIDLGPLDIMTMGPWAMDHRLTMVRCQLVL